MLTENFSFLRLDEDLGELFQTANTAEESYTYKHYENVLINTRKMAEHLAKLVANQCYLDADQLSFHETLNLIKDEIEDTSSYVMTSFRRLQGRGNKAAHQLNSDQATKDNAEKSLRTIHYLMVWYMKTYVDEEMNFADYLIPEARERYQSAERKFIYIQTVDNSKGGFDAYVGQQKIGEGSVTDSPWGKDTSPNSSYLRELAPKRIKQYMSTSGLPYQLGWVELAFRESDEWWFHDKDVHQVLKRSGIKQSQQLKGQEWFTVDLETAKEAIKAVKEGRHALNLPAEVAEPVIKLRPNQQDAVDQTKKVFKSKDRMLWNAKMRFGKTLATLQLVKDMGFEKVLLMTHRPVVKDSWFEDFRKMKMADAGYRYGSASQGETLATLKNGESHFVYFASIQLLRYGQGETNLSEFAEVDWDLIVVDEAHEGTQTQLSDKVMGELVKTSTKVLELSGTPFNLLDQYEPEQVYTWDYTMEQEAKLRWELKHPDQPNPYGELPRVEMFTFEMKNKEAFMDSTKSFNFREFFKVDEGRLVYEKEVKAFLDNISNPDAKTDYPFSKEEYRNSLRHTLWLLPGRAEATAFEEVLKAHPVFGQEYKIVNVVKDDDNEATADDLKKVRDAIGDDPSATKTITLTVRKLTTGVNVPEWNAVIFLSNTNSPMNYLQAAFRAQTPFSHEKLGKKEVCYVFDFAPDRALTVMAASAQLNSGVGKKNTVQQKKAMGKLLNFMPILGQAGNGMKTYAVDTMLEQLKKVYAEKAVQSGFEDDSLYNDQLLTLTAEDADTFKNLKAIVGTTKKEQKKSITVNENGLTDEEYETAEKAKTKKPRERSKEEKEALDKLNEAKKNRKAMISILRGVSIRIPMMIYGMAVDLEEDISIERFIKAVDEESWQEFMPKGFTKKMFRDIIKYYDPEVFIQAGRIIRSRAKSYDSLGVIERAEKIAELFSTFKNPDKETVLTPWRVVNLQLTKTLGGLNFYNEDYMATTQDGKSALHWQEQAVSSAIYQKDSKILDINAKTGLYPLHAAMSLYYKAVERNDDSHFDELAVYSAILRDNIYAVAKTPMAKTITQRTLMGYRRLESNVIYIENLTDLLKTKPDQAQEKIKESFKTMKFDVVIGNPPYQNEGIGDVARDEPIYHHFMELSYQLADKVALITPARFLFNAGQTPKRWNEKMLADKHLKVVHFTQNSNEVFPNTDIKGGVAVTYRDENQEFGEIGTFTHHKELNTILHKVIGENYKSFNELLYGKSSYKFTSLLYQKFPELRGRVSENEQKSIGSNIFEKLPEIFSDSRQNDNQVIILGRENNQRSYKYIDLELIDEHDNLDKYKVIIPASNGSGAIGEVLSTPLVGTPRVGHTQTFISFGAFETQDEAENCLKYIKTKFARAMLGTMKITQHNQSKEVWKNVPLQDFTAQSDVPWHLSIPEIDQYFYEKYGLNEEEIKFIEEKVREME